MALEFHHINFVSKNVDAMDAFYRNILEMDSIPIEQFPRTEETQDRGYSGKINFVTEGKIEMHLAKRNLEVGLKITRRSIPLTKATSLSEQMTSQPFSASLMRPVSRIPITEQPLPKNGIKYFFMILRATSSKFIKDWTKVHKRRYQGVPKAATGVVKRCENKWPSNP